MAMLILGGGLIAALLALLIAADNGDKQAAGAVNGLASGLALLVMFALLAAYVLAGVGVDVWALGGR